MDYGSESRGFEPRRSPSLLQVKHEDWDNYWPSFTATR
jgi:hypothetical protein